jgi:hypothetical protein
LGHAPGPGRHIDHAAGFDEHEGMPVVGRRDRDCVDILALDQLAIFLRRQIQILILEIANGDCLLIAMLEEGIVDLIATVPQPDETHADAIVRA